MRLKQCMFFEFSCFLSVYHSPKGEMEGALLVKNCFPVIHSEEEGTVEVGRTCGVEVVAEVLAVGVG